MNRRFTILTTQYFSLRAARSVKAKQVLIALLSLSIMMVSCSGAKKAAKEADLKKRELDELFRKMGQAQVAADWMDSKARLRYADEDMKIGLTASIRVQKDSAIWASVRKFGFEVARVLINPDSVYVLDRVNNEYMAKELIDIRDYIDLPADFGLLQSLVMGDLVLFGSRKPELKVVDNEFILSTNQPNLKSKYIVDRDFRLRMIEVDDIRANQMFEINYDDYQKVNGDKNFSYIRNLSLKEQTVVKAELEVRFSRVEFNIPKDISFEIPDKYTRRD